MTYEEALKKYGRKGVRKHYDDEEHHLQVNCVNWFRFEHKDLAPLLFAIPNGGQRNVATGARLKAEGVLAGVADLFLSVPNLHYHGLYIEMKTQSGYQSASQRDFEQNVSTQGYKYILCRSVENFIVIITKYLKNEL